MTITIKDLPKSIKVNGYRFNIKSSANPQEHVKEDDIDSVFAVFNSDDSTIYIHESLEDMLLKDTLMHEILHTIWFAAGICGVGADSYNEELVVGLLSAQLVNLFKDNKKLLEIYS